MVILIVRFESALSEEEVLAVARERADAFRKLPGLLQKYYIKTGKPNEYGGIYVWDSEASLNAYRESDLAASIPAAYRAVGPPTTERIEGMFQLRD